MKQIQELTEERKSSKRYEQFLYFVLLTLLVEFFPLFQKVLNNKLILLISILIIFVVISKLIGNGKIPTLLRNACERFKISLVFMYIAYILILYVLLVFIF